MRRIIKSNNNFQYPRAVERISNKSSNELVLKKIKLSPSFAVNISFSVHESGCSDINKVLVCAKVSLITPLKIKSSIPVAKIIAKIVMNNMRMNIVRNPLPLLELMIPGNSKTVLNSSFFEFTEC
jgi:hypothetical protein